MNALETAVRVIVDLLVRGEFATVEAVTRGRRLAADDIARAVSQYGRTIVQPGPDWWSCVEITPLAQRANAFHVAAPMWTVEEGCSDLTLELWAEESIPGIYATEILDLHVL